MKELKIKNTVTIYYGALASNKFSLTYQFSMLEKYMRNKDAAKYLKEYNDTTIDNVYYIDFSTSLDGTHNVALYFQDTDSWLKPDGQSGKGYKKLLDSLVIDYNLDVGSSGLYAFFEEDVVLEQFKGMSDKTQPKAPKIWRYPEVEPPKGVKIWCIDDMSGTISQRIYDGQVFGHNCKHPSETGGDDHVSLWSYSKEALEGPIKPSIKTPLKKYLNKPKNQKR